MKVKFEVNHMDLWLQVKLTQLENHPLTTTAQGAFAVKLGESPFLSLSSRSEHNLQPPGVGNPPAAQTSAPLLATCSRASSQSEVEVRRARRLLATCAEGHQLLMCQMASSSLTWPGDRIVANLAKRHR